MLRLLHASPEGTRGTRPGEVRNPTTEQKLAGLRNEPPVSLPSAIGSMPHASDTAAPPLPPPHVLVRSQGFFFHPNTDSTLSHPPPNPATLSFPIPLAP